MIELQKWTQSKLSPAERKALHLGMSHQRAGQLQEAKRVYCGVLRAHPGQPDALHLWGLVEHQIGEHRRAANLIKMAIRQRPKVALLRNNLGQCLGAQGLIHDAIAEYREAIRLNPDHLKAHVNLALSLRDAGDLKGAVVAYQQALQIDATLGPLHNNLASLLARLGRFNEARKHLSTAAELLPGHESIKANRVLIESLEPRTDSRAPGPPTRAGQTNPLADSLIGQFRTIDLQDAGEDDPVNVFATSMGEPDAEPSQADQPPQPPKGPVASPERWAGDTGRELILGLNGAPRSDFLTTWMAARWPKLFGEGASFFSVAGQSNRKFAKAFQKRTLRRQSARPAAQRPNLEDLVIEATATAINCYVSRESVVGKAFYIDDPGAELLITEVRSFGFQTTPGGLGMEVFASPGLIPDLSVQQGQELRVFEWLDLLNDSQSLLYPDSESREIVTSPDVSDSPIVQLDRVFKEINAHIRFGAVD